MQSLQDLAQQLIPDIPANLIDSIDPNMTLLDCEAQIEKSLEISDRLRWRVFVLLDQIRKTALYRTVLYPDGTCVHPTFSEYLESLSERIPQLSRRTVYDRIQTIRRLETLGIPMEEIVDRSPTALSQITDMGTWRRDGTLLQGDPEEMRGLIRDTADLPAGEVLAIVKERRGESKILFYGSLLSERGDEMIVEIRVIGTGGDVSFLKGSISHESATEIAKRLEFSWEE